MQRSICAVVFWVIAASFLLPGSLLGDDQPLATIAVISNPYITTLPGDQVRDERNSVRDYVPKLARESMEKTVALVNQLKPDALVVQGSLTWAGTAADFAAAAKYLDRIEVPVMTTPGHWDRRAGSLDSYRKAFGKLDVEGTVKSVNGVQLVFARDVYSDPDGASPRIEEQLSAIDSAKAVLLFSGKGDGEFARTNLTPTHEAFWKLVKDRKIAVRFDPIRYGHRILYENTLPVWAVGSTAWSERGSVTVVRVFADRVDIAQIRDPEQPVFSVSVPNPVSAPRLPRVEDDPYACPSFSADLATKPDFTFALISDPQFDRERSRETLIQKAEAGVRELNLLKPELVLVAGDLVNNNLPEEWALFKKVFSGLKPKLEVVAGNHDVLFNYDFVEQSYSSAPQQKPEYAALVKEALATAKQEGFDGPTALFEKFTGAKPNRIIEHREAAFITVSFLTMRADKLQIDFLKKALEQTKEKKHVFVVAHYPSLPAFGNNVQPQLGGDEVLSLLKQYRVTGYLFGHRHRNGFRMHDGTAHVLSDNMGSIHLLHVFPEKIVIGRKSIGVPLYSKLTIPATR
jgi:3',5'-cyclic AMP phosphodiesterase CpdA